jgi:hypothetical protein
MKYHASRLELVSDGQWRLDASASGAEPSAATANGSS